MRLVRTNLIVEYMEYFSFHFNQKCAWVYKYMCRVPIMVFFNACVQDLGMESTSLDDVLYRYASFRNLVDPITHDLIISLARYVHCPKTVGHTHKQSHLKWTILLLNIACYSKHACACTHTHSHSLMWFTMRLLSDDVLTHFVWHY